jgi:anti-anti-sigma factor
MNGSLELKIEDKLGCVWITLPDSIDMDTYRNIEGAIVARRPDNAACVVLDLSETKNLFSSGIGLIIRVRKQVVESKGLFVLVNVSRKVRKIFETVKLEKIFTMYSTDVEFEISQESLFKKRVLEDPAGFVFVSNIENDVYRIHLSGQMTIERNLSAIKAFTLDPAVGRHLFDLTGLDMIDSLGASILTKLLLKIHERAGKSAAYGANESIAGLFELLGLHEYITFNHDERCALESFGKSPLPS